MARTTSAAVIQKKRYLIEVCEEVLGSSRFSAESANGKFFRESAEKIVSQNGMEDLFGQKFKLSILWSSFQKYSISEKLQKTFCDALSLEIKPLFWQYVTEEIFKKLLQARVKAASTTDTLDIDVHDEELSFEEKNAINYIGGYIIKQLHTRVVTRKNFVDALQLLQSDLPTGLESAQWTETVDRGGLTHINEMFYLCLVAIEKVYKSCICGQDASQLGDIRNTIADKVLDDVDVKFYWDLATPVEVGDELLQMVVDLFLTVRSHAFTKGFMENYKQSNKTGTQKSKSLRKKLF